MDTLLQSISFSFFLVCCAALALLTAAFFYELIIYSTSKGDDAERSHAKKLVIRYSGFLFLYMLAWWLVPLIVRLSYATLLSWLAR